MSEFNSGSPTLAQASTDQLPAPDAGHLFKQAIASVRSGRAVEAVALLSEACRLAPDRAEYRNELGVVHFQLNQLPEAIAAFGQAVKLQPRYALALTNLGAACNQSGDISAGIALHEQAIAIDPGLTDAWMNAGKCWIDLGEPEKAIYCYHRAHLLAPQLARAAFGLASAYRHAGNYDLCRLHAYRALSLDPQFADAHFEFALACFHLEDYTNALRAFEWRMRKQEMLQHQRDLWPIFDRPAYAGEDLSDKCLLVHTEQGFGDNLQFARFLRLVRPHVKKLVMWCRPGLGELFAGNFPLDGVSENVFQLPEFDCHLPLLSIPRHFDPALATLHDFSPYLHAAPAAEPGMATDSAAFKIGLVWGASDSGFDHANKRIPLKALEPLFSIPGISWHSLQVGSDRNDLLASAHKDKLPDLGATFRNFADTASAVSRMDLVISCDTSVAHLAGAMGKPLWVMLKKNPDWRWHSDGETTIWYPSARLYRQYSPGNWAHVIHRIHQDLRRHISSGAHLPAQ